jgi:precorrin-2 methylase
MPTRAAPLERGLYVVGLGIPDEEAVTAEALDVLRRCDVLYAVDSKNPFIRGLNENVRELGVEGVGSAEAERRSAELLLKESARKAVAFAIYGHPLIYEPIGSALVREARRRRARVTTIAGVSALDVSLALLGESLEVPGGVHVGDVCHFLAREPDRDCALFIYKAAMVPDLLGRLLPRLAAARGAEARVAVVARRNFGVSKDVVKWTTLGALARSPRVPYYASLYVPPRAARARPR